MHKMKCTFSMSETQMGTCGKCKMLVECERGQRQGLLCERNKMKEKNEAYEQFVNEVTEAIKKIAGEEYLIISRNERKNNSVVLDGVMLQRENERVAPNIYLNHYYPKYCNGESVQQIAEQIIQLCEEKREEILTLTAQLDFSPEYIGSHLYYRLISLERNEELLREIPYHLYLDLAVVYYWVVYEEGEQLGSIMMTLQQMERMGWTEADLMRMAEENTPLLFPAMTKGIEEIVGEMLLRNTSFPMLVLSNEKGINGATCLMYPGVLTELEEKMQGSYYVLPSSIHELIVIPAENASASRLCEMVYCINRTQLPEEDILSDTVYYHQYGEAGLQLIGMGSSGNE